MEKKAMHEARFKLFYFTGQCADSAWPVPSDDAQGASIASHRLRMAIPALILQNYGSEIALVGSARQFENLVSSKNYQNAYLIIGKLSHPDPSSFQRIYDIACSCIQIAHSCGIHVVVDYCDDLICIGDHRSQPMFKLIHMADAIVCSSRRLRDRVCLYLGRSSRVYIIPDPVETQRKKPTLLPAPEDRPLKIIWFGHQSNIEPLIKTLPQINSISTKVPLELLIVSNLNEQDELLLQLSVLQFNLSYLVSYQPWVSPAELSRHLQKSDIALLPIDTNSSKSAASSNRLLTAFWSGCFVLASPIESYQEFGDFAVLTNDFDVGLQFVLANKEQIKDRVVKAQHLIQSYYLPETIANQWEELFLLISSPGFIEESDGEGLSCPKINLGCGHHPIIGYLNVDILSERAGVKPDLSCDIRNLSVFPSNFAQEILSVHVIEHFYRWEVEDILREWIRVLKPNGRLVVECPNLLEACKSILETHHARGPSSYIDQSTTMWVFYGDPAWKDPLMCHKWGYTPDTLIELLSSVGLKDATSEPAMFKRQEPRDMRVVAVKP